MSTTTPAGFRASGVTAGLKDSGRPDVAVVVNDGPDRHAAAVLRTHIDRSHRPAKPDPDQCQQAVPEPTPRTWGNLTGQLQVGIYHHSDGHDHHDQ